MDSRMDNEFAGKTALITGGTKGLGLATARALAARGCHVYLGFRSEAETAEKAARALRDEFKVRCEAFQADLSEESGIDKLFDALTAAISPHGGRLDLYVHNAAATAFKDLLELKAHHVDKTFNITVKSFLLGTQRAVAMMKDGGAIVTVSGMDTLKAVPRHGLLGAAKSALETLTAYFAHELASRKIRVNGVNPGFLVTDSTRKYLGPMFDAVSAGYARATPMQRDANLEEIADVILFLASKRSGWVVGQTLCVDGGFDFSMLA